MKKLLILLVTLFVASAFVVALWEHSKLLTILLILVVIGLILIVWNARSQRKLREKKVPDVAPAKPAQPEYTAEEKVRLFTADIVKHQYHYTDVPVYRPANAVTVEAAPGDWARFVLEPTNPHDPRSVRVETSKGELIGYLNKGKIRDLVYDFKSRWADEVAAMVTTGGEKPMIAIRADRGTPDAEDEEE